MNPFTDQIAQAIGDPGSITERIPDEPISRWCARAVGELLDTAVGIDTDGHYSGTPASRALMQHATLRGRLHEAESILADYTDGEPCALDREGYCLPHGLSDTRVKPCRNVRAQRLLVAALPGGVPVERDELVAEMAQTQTALVKAEGAAQRYREAFDNGVSDRRRLIGDLRHGDAVIKQLRSVVSQLIGRVPDRVNVPPSTQWRATCGTCGQLVHCLDALIGHDGWAHDVPPTDGHDAVAIGWVAEVSTMVDVATLRGRLARAEEAVTELSEMVASVEVERDRLWETFTQAAAVHQAALRGDTEKWRRRALHAQASLGWNRKATDSAGSQVVELRQHMAVLVELCLSAVFPGALPPEEIHAAARRAAELGCDVSLHFSSDPDNNADAQQAGGYDPAAPPTCGATCTEIPERMTGGDMRVGECGLPPGHGQKMHDPFPQEAPTRPTPGVRYE